MPKLHGFRELTNFNVWDCFSPRQLRDGEVKLFVTPSEFISIGDSHRTNMLMGGVLSSDQTTFIDNWYARTNIDTYCRPELPQAIAAWAAMSTVTLSMGTRPVLQRPLDELMAPRRARDMAGHAAKTPIETARDVVETVAQELFELFGETTTGPNWDLLSKEERETFRERAHSILAKIGPRFVPIIVPVRQYIQVSITSEPRSLAALLEVMPTNIAPQALCWIHLAGIQSRDVA